MQPLYPCPMCKSVSAAASVPGPDARTYRCCSSCRLIFTGSDQRLSAEEERARYLFHQNGPHHPGHVAFLNRLLEPLSVFISAGMRGLDFGCGPVPTLSVLLERLGVRCDNFDPHFFRAPPKGPYDLITATEVFEHLNDPACELERLTGLLAPGGYLAVMTERWQSPEHFHTWYYPRDPTHVVFYHEQTFDFICRRFGLRRAFIDTERVVIMEKQCLEHPGCR